MKNLEALYVIRESIQEVMDENGWGFVLYPLRPDVESVTWIRAQDVTNNSVYPESCQLIEGGKKFHTGSSGDLDDVDDRIELAIERLEKYARTCGLV